MSVKDKLLEKGYEKQVEILERLALDCIILKTSKSKDEEFSLGESKIGGFPQLPPNFEWPKFNSKPLAFLAQLNLEQIAKYDTQKLLPATGMLYFFHEGGEKVWGFDPKDKGGFKVAYYDGDMSELTNIPLPNDLEDYLKFSPCKLEFSCGKSYPIDLYGLDDEFFDTITEYLEGTINKLFGYPDLIQGDIFLESQLVTNGLYCGSPAGYNNPKAKDLEQGASEWVLLFQLDSDDNANMMWGDVGRIYFTIKKQDLKNKAFDASWSSFQCS
ncbi:MAG: YwqG family protein [Oscillospiraceae bacterium]|nr:YwqG family protein [Oscillospiraceae bacterium]